jgi:hypothetical protein
VADHGAGQRAEVPPAILGGPEIPLPVQAALRQIAAHVVRIHAEGESLVVLGQSGMQAIGADVPLGAGEHVRIDVGEDECVGGCGPGAPAECGVHGFLGEVVGDALPHEDGRQRGVVARRGHGRTELAQVEVTRNEGDIGWERTEGAGQGALLRLLRGRVVDLEDGDGPERLEPVRAGVESGTEDHQLTELLGRHGAQGVVDLTRAGHDGSAHARPPAVDGVAQGTSTTGD